jgi:hypothetical protein
MLRRTFFLPIPLLAALASVATADTVPAGFDLFRTDPSGTYIDFSLDPIPADFFGPGSDPFVGTVYFMSGDPFDVTPFCGEASSEPVDTVIERKQDAVLPDPTSVQTVDIEIVAMDLVSVGPIVVTYGGGNKRSEDWRMRVKPPMPVQINGDITITRVLDVSRPGTMQVLCNPKRSRFDLWIDRPSDGTQVYLQYEVLRDGCDDFSYSRSNPKRFSACDETCMNPGSPGRFYGPAFQWLLTGVCQELPVDTATESWGAIKAQYR